MNWADWVIVGILVISSFFGIVRGFVREALSLVTWAAALVIATTFNDPLARLLESYIDTASLRYMAAFGLLFVMSLVVGALIGHLISGLVKMTGLTGTDRLLGVLFGLARGFIIVMAILLFIPPLVPIDQDSWWQSSKLIPSFLTFEHLAVAIFDHVAKLFNHIFGR